MKVLLTTAVTAAVVLCLFLSETLGAKPAPPSKGNAITTRKSKAMNWESTPRYGNVGPSGPNPACVVCRVLSRTVELSKCIPDPQVLEFFQTMKSECVKDLGIVCPPEADGGSQTTSMPVYRQYQNRDLPIAVSGNRMARNVICIACFALARFNSVIECLFNPEDLQAYETFMQGCAGNFFMCMRT